MLTGDLKDFSLQEILQFLATTSSSGVLELRNAESHAGIAFHDGGVCLALLDMGGIHGLAARMIRAGGVDVARLKALGAANSGGAVALAVVLATETAEHDAAADVFLEHTVETMGWLTRREESQFLFEGSDQLDDWPFDVVALADAFAAIEERADEWDELSDIVSDLTRVASPVPDPDDGDEISLTGEQWRVLSLVDGRRRLKDLIELTGSGHLETCRQLEMLTGAGLIEMVASDETSALDDLLGGLDALRPRGAAAAQTRASASAAPAHPPRPPAHAAAVTGAAVTQQPAMAAPGVPVAPSGAPDAPAVQPAEAMGDVEGLASAANRAMFDQLMGGGGAAP